MGANFPRVKVWSATEDVEYDDLNAEFDNLLTNLTPSGADDYSANTTQMQTTTDPGEVGSESLATSLAGEIERLRFIVKEITGETQWYASPSTSLTDIRNVVGGGLAPNRISSGAKSASSSQLISLVPGGSTNTLKLEGAPTNFVYYVADIAYTISADVTISGLSLAPSSNNTAAVDDTNAADGLETKYLGEFGTVINIDTVGSEISSLVGKRAGFAINNGSTTEYFTAFVASSTQLTKARRGYFFNSSSAAIPRVAFANNDTITLMKLVWIFVNTSGSLVVTYNEPVYSGTQPTSPATGDYWFDLANNVWKTFDSVSWNTANATLVGEALTDSTNCVAAWTVDGASGSDDLNTVDLERTSNSTVRIKNYGAQINVYGTVLRYGRHRLIWDMASHLDSGLTEASSTTYYLYLKESGSPVISDVCPTDRRGDRQGYYHPTETWRCVGHIVNNSSSHLDAKTLVAFSRTKEAGFFSNDLEEIGVLKATTAAVASPGWRIANGASVSRFLYNDLYADAPLSIGTASGTADAYTFNIPDTVGYFLRGLDTGTSGDPDSASRTASATGGNTGATVGTIQAGALAAHKHNMVGYDGSASGATNFTDAIIASATTAGTYITRAQGAENATNSYIIQNTGGNETRPRNVAVNYLIKVLA